MEKADSGDQFRAQVEAASLCFERLVIAGR